MSSKNNGVNHSMLTAVKERRRNAYSRLKTQLTKGSKKSKDGNELIQLTDKDKKRIEKEMEILKARF